MQDINCYRKLYKFRACCQMCSMGPHSSGVILSHFIFSVTRFCKSAVVVLIMYNHTKHECICLCLFCVEPNGKVCQLVTFWFNGSTLSENCRMDKIDFEIFYSLWQKNLQIILDNIYVQCFYCKEKMAVLNKKLLGVAVNLNYSPEWRGRKNLIYPYINYIKI